MSVYRTFSDSQSHSHVFIKPFACTNVAQKSQLIDYHTHFAHILRRTKRLMFRLQLVDRSVEMLMVRKPLVRVKMKYTCSNNKTRKYIITQNNSDIIFASEFRSIKIIIACTFHTRCCSSIALVKINATCPTVNCKVKIFINSADRNEYCNQSTFA